MDPRTTETIPSSDSGDPPDQEEKEEGGSALAAPGGENDAEMDDQQWQTEVMQEVTETFRKLPDRTGEPTIDEVIVRHSFDFDAQVRIQADKRRWEDCGVVFCTLDMSPSRDTFTQWIYQEVENRAAVQVQHVKILAARHYLILLNSMEARDLVLTSGPYYMRRRMIYTTPWEPGFDTSKVLAKKMACWLDLMEVDPMLEMEGQNMLSALGEVLQTAGITKQGAGKFAHIRGCVLLDMSKPLPTVLVAEMNGEEKRFCIKYDTLHDACFVCQERGHFAKNCPKNKDARPPPIRRPRPDADQVDDGFQYGTRRLLEEEEAGVSRRRKATSKKGVQSEDSESENEAGGSKFWQSGNEAVAGGSKVAQ
ncbi:hypothetical protein R1sor_010226 [Riccia sorocarpa]|uniref:CCHC-type domain-containing protein n=1 Tax=Riccia sorocarpa TaxID=122646 RepID=A0ABD3HXD9_9MARC